MTSRSPYQVLSGIHSAFFNDESYEYGLNVEIEPLCMSSLDECLSICQKFNGYEKNFAEKLPDLYRLLADATIRVLELGVTVGANRIRPARTLSLNMINNYIDHDHKCIGSAHLMATLINKLWDFTENYSTIKNFYKRNIEHLKIEQIADFYSTSEDIYNKLSRDRILDNFLLNDAMEMRFVSIFSNTPMLSTLMRGTVGLPYPDLWLLSGKCDIDELSKDRNKDYRCRLKKLADHLIQLEGHNLRVRIGTLDVVLVVQVMELFRASHQFSNENEKDCYRRAVQVLSDIFLGPEREGFMNAKRIFKKNAFSSSWLPDELPIQVIRLLDGIMADWDETSQLAKPLNRARVFTLAGALDAYHSRMGKGFDQELESFKSFINSHADLLLDPNVSKHLSKGSKSTLIRFSNSIQNPEFITIFIKNNKSVRGEALEISLGL